MLTNLGSGTIAKVGHLVFNETIIADIHPTPPLPKKRRINSEQLILRWPRFHDCNIHLFLIFRTCILPMCIIFRFGLCFFLCFFVAVFIIVLLSGLVWSSLGFPRKIVPRKSTEMLVNLHGKTIQINALIVKLSDTWGRMWSSSASKKSLYYH